jgi:AraC family transcriptional regulator
MIDTGAYAERMARYLHLEDSPVYATLGSGNSALAVTRLHAPRGFFTPTDPIPVEKAFSIHLHLRTSLGGKLWLGGKLEPTGKRPSGGVTILDLEHEPIAFFPNPIEVIQFYIPRVALEEFAYEHHLPKLDTLRWPHCEMDTTLKHLGKSLLFSIQQSRQTSRLFLDNLGQAVLAHATFAYGGVRSGLKSDRGHLAPWQTRRAKELLSANLNGDISLSSVAAECGLSVSHFAHAFRKTFGQPPHKWLMEQRLDAVKNLLLTSRLSLAEIASQYGFSDQPSLNRFFRRFVGESPGEWRRSRKSHL